MKNLKTIHLAVGLACVVLFLLSGLFMHYKLGHLVGMATGPRLLFRSAHIYLLWSSLLNLLLGCYLVQLRPGVLRVIQRLGSVALLAGPPLLCFAFFYEPYMKELARPFARAAIYAAFAGAGLQALAVFLAGKRLRIVNVSLGADDSRQST